MKTTIELTQNNSNVPLLSKNRWSINAYLFLLPSLAALIVFVFIPFFQTLERSLYLTDNMGKNALFIGLENYILLFKDPSFYNSLFVTLNYVAIVVVVGVLLGFTTALLCQKSFPGVKIFSTAYALPLAIASSGMALVFGVMLNQTTGILNRLLHTNINWIADPKYAIWSVGILTGWLNSGMNFLFFSSGLAGISENLYESASIDGANQFHKLIYITIPSLMPITFFVVVTNIINAFQSFGQIKLLTQGGPGESTNVIVHDIYRNAFMNYRYGYASAESVILFFIIMIFTYFMFRARKRGL
ncbi:carbohydrate ABC transporter permease [Microaceticoccus formicicus]|uniref:carbohydrate ABC transporter permease n=1 Tax=Microaceticoccus formicicus TaxID=3118105 RepID=UPI003CCFFB59|nr:sugar ABC transporter permease [Peptoniphilaceae bacterium AMB_02]